MATPEGETNADAIRARWKTEHAEAARAQDIARFIAPLAMFD